MSFFPWLSHICYSDENLFVFLAIFAFDKHCATTALKIEFSNFALFQLDFITCPKVFTVVLTNRR